MENTATCSEISLDRENMYKTLSHLFKTEVDEKLLGSMKKMAIPAEGSEELLEGYELLNNYLNSPLLDPLTDLAVDYAKVFLGAGKTESELCAYPYESVYTSPERLLMQDARDEVLEKYREFGLDKSKDLNEPEDHISFELEFMGKLCVLTREALAAEDDSKVSFYLNEQKRFLADHLLNWIPEFCGDIEKHGNTDFYKGIARITEAFLKMDVDMVEDLIDTTSA